MQMIILQISSSVSLRSMTGTMLVIANKFDRNYHTTFEILWRNPQFWTISLHELSFRIKLQYINWLAGSIGI